MIKPDAPDLTVFHDGHYGGSVFVATNEGGEIEFGKFEGESNEYARFFSITKGTLDAIIEKFASNKT